MRPLTRAAVAALCRRLGLDPHQVTRITVLPGRVVVDRFVETELGLLEITDSVPVTRPTRRLP